MIKLTKKEKAIMEYIKSGLSNADIAKKMGVGQAAVKMHLTSMFKKLGIKSRLQLAVLGKDKEMIIRLKEAQDIILFCAYEKDRLFAKIIAQNYAVKHGLGRWKQ